VFDEPLIDPTAGERAREISLHPERPQRVMDPTDPRSGADAPRVASLEAKDDEAAESGGSVRR